jgi:hypothetical protein
MEVSGSSLVKQKGQASYSLGGVTERLVKRMDSSISLRHFGFGQTVTTDSSDNLAASQRFFDNLLPYSPYLGLMNSKSRHEIFRKIRLFLFLSFFEAHFSIK